MARGMTPREQWGARGVQGDWAPRAPCAVEALVAPIAPVAHLADRCLGLHGHCRTKPAGSRAPRKCQPAGQRDTRLAEERDDRGRPVHLPTSVTQNGLVPLQRPPVDDSSEGTHTRVHPDGATTAGPSQVRTPPSQISGIRIYSCAPSGGHQIKRTPDPDRVMRMDGKRTCQGRPVHEEYHPPLGQPGDMGGGRSPAGGAPGG